MNTMGSRCATSHSAVLLNAASLASALAWQAPTPQTVHAGWLGPSVLWMRV